MKERYGRDKYNHSHAGIPFYTGNSCDNGRDGVIWTLTLVAGAVFRLEVVGEDAGGTFDLGGTGTRLVVFCGVNASIHCIRCSKI